MSLASHEQCAPGARSRPAHRLLAVRDFRLHFVQAYYPPEMLGRISTSVQVVNYGAIPIGAVLASAAASYLGVRPTLRIMLTGLVLSSCILLLGPLRKLRDLPACPEPARTPAAGAVR